jgi:hypothetical protein
MPDPHTKFLIVPGISLAPLSVFLLDGVCGPKPFLPDPLERTRHQAVLRFDRVVLASRALGVIACAFPSQRPLLLELPRFMGHLIHGGDGDLDLVRREGFQEHLGNQVVHRTGSDLLAQGYRGLVLVGATTVDGTVAVGTRIAYGHPTATAAAHGDTLEKGRALAGSASTAGFGAVGVVAKAFLVCHELLPADVARVGR